MGPTTSTAASASRTRRALLEVALLAGLYVAYSLARVVGDAGVGEAVRHAEELLRVEAFLHIDIETWTNRALHAVPVLPVLASYWYASLHYLVTPAVLVLLWRRAPGQYRLARTTLVIGSAIGLVGFTLLPMAPPRMLPGYVDTLAATSGTGWWGADASAPRGLGGMTNELAAMPSLHVGWAVWCAWAVLLLTADRRLRRLGVLYAVGTAVVVVATANHYLLDAVAGVAVLAVGRVAAGALEARRSRSAGPVVVDLGHRVPAGAPACEACAA